MSVMIFLALLVLLLDKKQRSNRVELGRFRGLSEDKVEHLLVDVDVSAAEVLLDMQGLQHGLGGWSRRGLPQPNPPLNSIGSEPGRVSSTGLVSLSSLPLGLSVSLLGPASGPGGITGP